MSAHATHGFNKNKIQTLTQTHLPGIRPIGNTSIQSSKNTSQNSQKNTSQKHKPSRGFFSRWLKPTAGSRKNNSRHGVSTKKQPANYLQANEISWIQRKFSGYLQFAKFYITYEIHTAGHNPPTSYQIYDTEKKKNVPLEAIGEYVSNNIDKKKINNSGNVLAGLGKNVNDIYNFMEKATDGPTYKLKSGVNRELANEAIRGYINFCARMLKMYPKSRTRRALNYIKARAHGAYKTLKRKYNIIKPDLQAIGKMAKNKISGFAKNVSYLINNIFLQSQQISLYGHTYLLKSSHLKSNGKLYMILCELERNGNETSLNNLPPLTGTDNKSNALNIVIAAFNKIMNYHAAPTGKSIYGTNVESYEIEKDPFENLEMLATYLTNTNLRHQPGVAEPILIPRKVEQLYDLYLLFEYPNNSKKIELFTSDYEKISQIPNMDNYSTETNENIKKFNELYNNDANNAAALRQIIGHIRDDVGEDFLNVSKKKGKSPRFPLYKPKTKYGTAPQFNTYIKYQKAKLFNKTLTVSPEVKRDIYYKIDHTYFTMTLRILGGKYVLFWKPNAHIINTTTPAGDDTNPAGAGDDTTPAQTVYNEYLLYNVETEQFVESIEYTGKAGASTTGTHSLKDTQNIVELNKNIAELNNMLTSKDNEGVCPAHETNIKNAKIFCIKKDEHDGIESIIHDINKGYFKEHPSLLRSVRNIFAGLFS